MTTFLFWVTIISYLLVLAIFVFQISNLRKQKKSMIDESSFRQLLEHSLDSLAITIVLVCKEVLHHISVSLLVIGQKFSLIAKYAFHRLEKRFSKVIVTVQGKRDLSKQGDVSNFLQQIKHHQENLRSDSLV